MLLPLLLNNLQSQATQRSGVNRLWLIEYYTREWAQSKPAPAEVMSQALAKPTVPDKKIAAKIERLVNKAEKQIASQLQTMKFEHERHLYIAALMQSGVKLARSQDFAAVADRMRKKLRDDDELMLLALVL